jgi:modification methylase
MVRADGSLVSGPHQGSIHKVGALVQGSESCNGWTFWHHEQSGRMEPIDTLRADIRQKLDLLSA